MLPDIMTPERIEANVLDFFQNRLKETTVFALTGKQIPGLETKRFQRILLDEEKSELREAARVLWQIIQSIFALADKTPDGPIEQQALETIIKESIPFSSEEYLQVMLDTLVHLRVIKKEILPHKGWTGKYLHFLPGNFEEKFREKSA